MTADGKSYGCIMVEFDMPEQLCQSVIKRLGLESDVYDDDSKEYGIETKPHVTLLYGIHEDVSLDEIKKHLPSISEMTAIISGISHFKCNDYDVLKFDIDSPKLHEINKNICDNVPFTNEFPDYIPHMTIAYLKKGCGEKYNDNNYSIPIKPLRYRYGFADNHDEYFTL